MLEVSKSKDDILSCEIGNEIFQGKKISGDKDESKCNVTTRSGRLVKTANRLSI